MSRASAEFLKDGSGYYFQCPCGNRHEMDGYPIAQLASGNDLIYECKWNNKVRKVKLSSKKFQEI